MRSPSPSTARRRPPTTSGRARACCTCCASGWGCPARRTPASRASAARARSTSTGCRSARAWSRPARPRAARSAPWRAWPRRGRARPRCQQAFVERGRRPVRVLHAGPDRRGRTTCSSAASPAPVRRGDPRGAGGQPVPLHGLREDPGRGAPRRRRADAEPMTSTLVIEGAAIAHRRRRRHRVRAAATSSSTTAGSPSRRPGPAPRRRRPSSRRRDGCLLTPGLVNTHHHLYQWATRGARPPRDACSSGCTGAVPDLGRASTPRSCAATAGAGLGCAGAARLHDQHRPPLRLPRARPATCSAAAGRGRRRGRAAVPPDAGARWTSARSTAGCRRTTVVETTDDASSPPPRRRSTASTTRRRARCCGSRCRALLAVLGDAPT